MKTMSGYSIILQITYKVWKMSYKITIDQTNMKGMKTKVLNENKIMNLCMCIHDGYVRRIRTV